MGKVAIDWGFSVDGEAEKPEVAAVMTTTEIR